MNEDEIGEDERHGDKIDDHERRRMALEKAEGRPWVFDMNDAEESSLEDGTSDGVASYPGLADLVSYDHHWNYDAE